MMSQALLEPVPAGLDQAETDAVLAARETLAPFGYGLEPGNDGSAQLTRIPAELDTAEAVAGLQELAALLLEGHSPDPVAMRDTALHTIACKAAIKAGSPSGQAELEALAREALTREEIKYCPHGRPVCIRLTRSALDRQFGRG